MPRSDLNLTLAFIADGVLLNADGNSDYVGKTVSSQSQSSREDIDGKRMSMEFVQAGINMRKRDRATLSCTACHRRKQKV
jgi:hypothetical protein